MQLSETATKEDIKKAHQTRAFYTHPDKNPDTPGAEREFDDINRAYSILLDYCTACEQSGQKDRCSFNQEDFKRNAVFVKIKE